MHEFKSIEGYAVPAGHVLVLRTSGADGRSLHRDAGGFRWPDVGGVAEAPDWDPAAMCGNGLHGALWGEGEGLLFSWDADALWQCIEADGSSVVDLGDKVKFPRGRVVATGGRADVTGFIRRHGARGAVVGLVWTVVDRGTVTGGDGATVTGGDEATVAGGYHATVTGGYQSTVTGGHYATVTGGHYATVTGGDRATVTGGDGATVTGGDRATVTGGDGATVTGGDHATVTGGDDATVTGGDHATVTGGDDATVTGGDHATVTGGDDATLEIVLFDGDRRRRHVAYIGETLDGDGAVMEPNVAYRWDNGWVRAR